MPPIMSAVLPLSEPLPRPTAGEIIGERYELEAEVTESVWLAKEGETQWLLDFVPPALWHDPALQGDLRREVARHQRLTHPATFRVEGIEPWGDTAALVLEAVQGEPLNVLLDRDGARSPEVVHCWMVDLCEALAEAHEKENLVHREIDPSRIVVTPEGKLKLSDFGITALLRAFGDNPPEMPALASPQQIAGEPPAPADDIYSLGALAGWLLTGHAVTDEASAGDLPEAWRDVVVSALQTDPAKRPGSVRQFAERLAEEPAGEEIDEEVAEEPVPAPVESAAVEVAPVALPAPPVPAPVPVAPVPQKRSTLAPVLTLLLLGAAGAGGWWFGIEQPRRESEREAAHRAALTAEQEKLALARQQIEATRAELERLTHEKAAVEVSAAEAAAAKAKAEAAAAAAFRAAAEEKATRADRLTREALELFTADPQPDLDARLFLLLREAADLGNPEAAAYLGGLYLDGRGTERNPKEALRLLERAAKRSGYAQWRLGTMYEEGIGAKQDRAKAITYYRSAADQGQPGALYRLAESQLDSDDPGKSAEALQWMTEAALGGYPEAQSRLGVIYGIGAGIPQDDETAFRWLDTAEAQKWRVADDYAVIAVRWHQEEGMSERTLRWYRKAGERGNLSAQMELATYFLKKTPLTPADIVEAREWLGKASAQGDAKATSLLGTLPEITPAEPPAETPPDQPE